MVLTKKITEMLSLTTKEFIILFDMEFYSQIDGVAMESPLGPTLANIFLCHHEKKWLNDCPNSFKSFFIRETLMTSLSCLKNLNMFKFLLTTWTVNTKTFRFLMKQEKMKRYLS